MTLAPGVQAQGPEAVERRFDVLIRNGWVVDGTGAPGYRADVGIVGDTIAAIGRLAASSADRTLDAEGRVVVPGFIDLHAHLTDGDLGRQGLLSDDRRRRAAQNFVAQGITTAVVNPDGYQSMPLEEQRSQLERLGIGLNVASLSGHSRLRHEAMMGDVERPATAGEIRRMQDALRRDLASGESFGMSLGMEYEGRHATLEEQVELGKVLGAYNGVFAPHLRSQGVAPMWYQPSHDLGSPPPTLDDAIAETLQVAERSGATVLFTHMKARGPGYRGQAERIVQVLDAARRRGARIYMDAYPYATAESDSRFVAIPEWAFGEHPRAKPADFDYREAFLRQWSGMDRGQREMLARDIRHRITYRGGPERILLLEFPQAEYVGKRYADLMALWGQDEVQLALSLVERGDPRHPGGARFRSFSMDVEDIETFYRLDWCAVSTDGWVVLPEDAGGERKYVDTHPRAFGSYPRRLAYFSSERGVDTLEHAVRAGTGLPAHILGVVDRGRLMPGLKADVVILDMARLRDRTTSLQPSVYPSGVDHVLVNGRFAVDGGAPTLELHGRVLRRSVDKDPG